MAMLELAPVGNGLYRRGHAGDTFNTIWHMAQLLGSAATAGFVTRVSRDVLSDACVAEMAADGLDVSSVARGPERGMGLYLIELDGAGLVHLSGITLAILPSPGRETLFAVLAKARRASTGVSFDPNIRPRLWSSGDEIRETISRMLALTDIALPSFDDEAAHWGDRSPQETIERFGASGVGEIAVKNGSGSIRFRPGDLEGECPTPSVEGIRDTTGAGDAFNAGYLAARLAGLSSEKSISCGQMLSAEVIRTPGARGSKETVRELGRSLIAS